MHYDEHGDVSRLLRRYAPRAVPADTVHGVCQQLDALLANRAELIATLRDIENHNAARSVTLRMTAAAIARAEAVV